MRPEMYRVAIVEDDLDQQELVTRLLKKSGDFEVLGAAGNLKAGVELLTKAQPDLVILDVLLPPNNCFELLNALTSIPFKIIFTTSHDEYAIRAFRLSAVDYLLKPLDPAEFAIALEKFRTLMDSEDQSTRIRNMLSNMRTVDAGQERVALPTLTGFLYLPIKDIVRCESDNTYTTVFTTDKKQKVISRTLKECEAQLQGLDFFRIHNSHLVNLRHVQEYLKGEGGMVRMTDGSTLDVSRRRKEEFLRRFNTL